MLTANMFEKINGIINTLWMLKRYKVISEMEAACGHDVPVDCMKLIGYAYFIGARDMAGLVGKEWRKTNE